jgi:hypothetical protein
MGVIECKHCPSSTYNSVDVARISGWRMFTGKSLTGKPLDDVVCPKCAGTERPADEEPSWSVRCNTCDWVWEDEYGEGPLDARAARNLASDHECEPWVEIAPPNSEQWISPNNVNDDGSLRGDTRMSKPLETAAVKAGLI